MDEPRNPSTGAYRPPLTVKEQAPDAATILRRLRQAYPHWAFLHDSRTSTWTALRGRNKLIARTNPIALRAAVDAAQPRLAEPHRPTRAPHPPTLKEVH